jgi:hypothetical protein
MAQYSSYPVLTAIVDADQILFNQDSDDSQYLISFANLKAAVLDGITSSQWVDESDVDGDFIYYTAGNRVLIGSAVDDGSLAALQVNGGISADQIEFGDGSIQTTAYTEAAVEATVDAAVEAALESELADRAKLLFSQYTAVTISNTTAATSLLSGSKRGSVTIPANTLIVGSVVKLTLEGYLSTTSGSQSITFALNIGGGVLINLAVGSITGSLSNAKLVITSTVTVYSSNTVRAVTEVTVNDTSVYTPLTSTVSVVIASDNAITATAQWGAASSSNTIVVNNAYAEQL